jgi:hypothetical protein
MLIQKLWQVTWDHRNEILHRHENLITLVEASSGDVIATRVQEELVIGMQSKVC